MSTEYIERGLRPIIDEIRERHLVGNRVKQHDIRGLVSQVIHKVFPLSLRKAVVALWIAGPNSSERKTITNGIQQLLLEGVYEGVYKLRCETCQSKIVKAIFPTNLKAKQRFCSLKCMASNQDVKASRVRACLERFGAPNPLQSKEIRKKMQATLLKRYGVTNVSQSTKVKTKKTITSLTNYGVSNPSKSAEIRQRKLETYQSKHGKVAFGRGQATIAKRINTCRQRYGMDSTGGEPTRLAKMKETLAAKTKAEKKRISLKRKRTCLERYGVTNPNKLPEIRRKILSSSYDSYNGLINGKIYKGLQGYEAAGVRFISEHSSVRMPRIKAGDDPSIDAFDYKFRGRIRTYHPDIRVGDSYFEVKSTYTAGIFGQRKEETYRLFQAKLKAVEIQGKKAIGLVSVGKQWVILDGSGVPKSKVLSTIRRLKADPSIPFLRLRVLAP